MKTTPETGTTAEHAIRIEPVFHYINGQFQPGHAGRSFETLNPATNQPLTSVAEGLTEDIDDAVRAARTAFDEGPWPRLSTAERAQFLMRIADAIEAHGDEIALLEVHDAG